ncbi:MAG: molybdopterin-guanine dinucleotide biosynthesis protein B, partial [Rhodospirillales bacterium]|nr:molybdopterin-guanine dinucleotide biosynthesis protein B [Rhodospirillales bacterium]
GFKSYPHPKIEVHRPSIGKPLLNSDDPSVVAVASDGVHEGIKVPILDLNDVVSITDFVLNYVGLTSEVRSGTA